MIRPRDELPGTESARRPASSAQVPPVVDVQTLFRGQAEVRLVHRDVEYRLRITRQGKLILTK